MPWVLDITKADANANDEELLKADINRYYDVYGIETDYRQNGRARNRIFVNPTRLIIPILLWKFCICWVIG